MIPGSPSEADLAWAAGFLEGEGWFSPNTLRAAQADREPLDRLVRILGGRVTLDERPSNTNPNRQAIFRWYKHDEGVGPCIAWLWPWLSQRRRLQCTYDMYDARRPTRYDAEPRVVPAAPPSHQLMMGAE